MSDPIILTDRLMAVANLLNTAEDMLKSNGEWDNLEMLAGWSPARHVFRLEREILDAKKLMQNAIEQRNALGLKLNKAEGRIGRLLGLVKRARDMINVSPEDTPDKWPSTGEINTLVKDCDEALNTERSDRHEN